MKKILRALDEVTPPAGDAWLVASTDKQQQKFDGLVHDLLHEPERAQVIDTLLGWMDAHLPAGAP